MKKDIKVNQEAPAAIGPYSPAVKIGNLVFVSGQLPIDPATGSLATGEIEEQTKRSLENLKAVLEPYSIGLENVVKITIFLKDMTNFSRINTIYAEYFTDSFPARSCVEVARLPKDAGIEIEAIAFAHKYNA